MDIKSILGYQKGSPFAGNPYIDIQSNIIDMSNTPIDLLGIDNKGNKKKMKAGRKNPYRFEGDMVREIPMQQGGIYANQQQLDEANAELARLLTRQGASQYDIANTRVKGTVGSPRIPLVGSPLQNPLPVAASLPPGVTPDMIVESQQGYGFNHPQTGNFTLVNPNLVRLQKPVTPPPAYAKAFQKGGYTAKDLYNYLFADDYEDDDEEYSDNENTAPSEAELGVADIQQPQEPDDYEIALQAAMGQDELMVTARNPYVKNVASVRAVGTNPYTPESVANVSNPTKYAFEFFQKKGLAPHIAAGIVGNLMQESGNFRPDVITDEITGDNGASHGIAQWQKNRWPAFLSWASSQGKNPKALDTQLEYVYVEANQRGDLTKVSTAKNSSEAANLFAKYYERPAVIDKNRSRNARQLYPD